MKQVVLITGASKGIGRALAEKMLDENFIVIGTSTSGIIKAITHENFHALKLDVSNSDSIENAYKTIIKDFKQIDILINNAGVGPDLGASQPDSESFDKTFEVNVKGTVFFTERFLPIVKNGGKVIIISSRMGSISCTETFDSVAYRMSKSALNMYTKILSNRLEGKLTIAAIDPGWVQTEIRMSNLVNAPLTPKTSAENIYRLINSNFESGVLWDTLNREAHNW